ncbi:glycerol-3-phosphate dehydrogenase [Myxococcota bacterium]|nr:glycerol-3-phosphate dehydrogenase [Myxococcota bacterium]
MATSAQAEAAKNAWLFDARRRQDVFSLVDGAIYDLIVIGGGINGAGVAHDAALRGLRVLLVEQRDLAFGTSSRSSKLIHGGLRYLEHYQFKLVFEGTNERAALRKIAPHLVRPLLFALPVYEDDRHPLWLVDVGLWMYDSLSLFKVENRHITMRSPKRMLEREPLLNPKGLTGGIIYYDCMTDDARLTLENAMAAAELGTPVLTHARVVDIDGIEGRDPVRVVVEDQLTGRRVNVRGKGIVNCTGAWTDSVRRLAHIEDSVIRPTKGVHLVVPKHRLPVHHAAALIAPQDGRVFFAIPWNGRTVIGTTDTDYQGDPAELACEASDVDYMLAAANHHFPSANLVPSDVIATWVGLRPLIRVESGSASDVPREHKLYRDGRMVTIAGGKLTTYRRMAAEVVDAAADATGARCAGSSTGNAVLPGARGITDDFDMLARQLRVRADMPDDVALRLANVYGARAKDIVELAQKDERLFERITPDRDAIMAEVVYGVERELAVSLEDVLVRRTSIALTAQDQGLGAAERVAALMASRLGWDDAEKQRNLDEYARSVALTRKFRAGPPAARAAG